MTSVVPVFSEERHVASALQDPIDIIDLDRDVAITLTLEEKHDLKNRQAVTKKLLTDLISSSDDISQCFLKRPIRSSETPMQP